MVIVVYSSNSCLCFLFFLIFETFIVYLESQVNLCMSTLKRIKCKNCFKKFCQATLFTQLLKGNYFTNTFHLNECDNKIDNLNQLQCNLLAKYCESSFRLLTGYLSYLIQKQSKYINIYIYIFLAVLASYA